MHEKLQYCKTKLRILQNGNLLIAVSIKISNTCYKKVVKMQRPKNARASFFVSKNEMWILMALYLLCNIEELLF